MWKNKTMKYGNRKINTPDGEFDSTKEYHRWLELKLLLKAGAISHLERQVKFELIPSQRIDGKVVERSCNYIADFAYYDNDLHRTVVEDTKGFRTKEYLIKRKLMLYVHNIRINEV